MEQKKLTGRQQRAIVALLELSTETEVAEYIGVTSKTLRRWKKEPHFQEAYKQARADMMASTISRLQKASNAAVATLEYIMASNAATPASRVTAARAVLDLALKATEIEEIAERLTKLEARLEGLHEQTQPAD